MKGLNFAITPKHIPATEIIAGIESSMQNMDSEAIDSIRREVKTTLTKAKLPISNINYGQRRSLKSIREDTSIAILPADKCCSQH